MGQGLRALADIAEAQGQPLSAAAFFMFGVVAIPLVLEEVSLRVALYAVLTFIVVARYLRPPARADRR